MPTQTFIADSAADALAQIRAELGPEAVVLNVRQVTGPGISRLWQKPRIEVIAHVPDPTPAAPAAAPVNDGVMELRRELAVIRSRMELERRVSARQSTTPTTPEPASPKNTHPTAVPAEPELTSRISPKPAPDHGQGSAWRVGQLLERAGLEGRHARRLEEECEAAHGLRPPAAMAEELALAQQALTRLWRPAPGLSDDPRRPHVFVGAPGAGKTTLLCKWLAQTVLLEGRPAHVWRLDGNTANTAEALSVYGDILGTHVSRFWRGAEEADAAAISFVDLPGIAWRDPAAMAGLGALLASLPGVQVHLVLNAAYEVPLLLAQVRAFAALGVVDVCLTHLDEEIRWGKLWNLVLGTNLPLRFLSAGQNVPGELFAASAEKIFTRQFAGI